MSESVVVVCPDATEDRFDVMPDGTGRAFRGFSCGPVRMVRRPPANESGICRCAMRSPEHPAATAHAEDGLAALGKERFDVLVRTIQHRDFQTARMVRQPIWFTGPLATIGGWQIALIAFAAALVAATVIRARRWPAARPVQPGMRSS